MQLNIAEEAAYAEAPMQDEGFGAAAMPAQPDLVTLRRTGQRPINFRGATVAHGMSFRVGTPLWYEVNVFKASTGGFVGDVRMFTKADGEQDKFTVHIAGSLEEIVDFLEEYNPAEDIIVDVNFDDKTMTLADLTFKALAVRARSENAKAQYECLVCDIFSQLETARAQGEA